MKKLLVANWKMNPQSERDAVKLAVASDAKNVVICPPFPFLPAVKKVVKKAAIGAQDMFWEEQGAYTGEVSSTMLAKLGAKYVIIGHSERRGYMAETDEVIEQKVHAAVRAGLRVILCVGEPREVREKGIAAAEEFVVRQLAKDLDRVHPKDLIVAYEPIWAIGNGTPDDPAETMQIAGAIRSFVDSRTNQCMVLYGGSVNAGNIAAFIGNQVIDGALVGGASLRPQEFKTMVEIVADIA